VRQVVYGPFRDSVAKLAANDLLVFVRFRGLRAFVMYRRPDDMAERKQEYAKKCSAVSAISALYVARGLQRVRSTAVQARL
jgi:hypothetical protein